LSFAVEEDNKIGLPNQALQSYHIKVFICQQKL